MIPVCIFGGKALTSGVFRVTQAPLAYRDSYRTRSNNNANLGR